MNVYLIGNAHIDPIWMWDKTEGLSEIKSTFRSALDRMKEFPDYVFTSACASYYKWIEQVDPAMFAEIKARVAEGRWDVVGGMWLQPDCNLPGGEAFARHFLYAQRYFKEKLGTVATVGYNVDSFGHNAALPMILAKAGITRYVAMRAGDEEDPDMPVLFHWESPDGSRVTMYRIIHGYGGGTDRMEFIRDQALREKRPLMAFYGVGNHGGGPTIRHLEHLTELIAKHGDMCHAPVARYFDDAEAAGFFKDIPVVKTDLQHHASGCYAAHAGVKAANRRAEHALMAAEKYDLLARSLTGAESLRAQIQPAWEKVLFNQFHDVLAGPSIREAYVDALNAYGSAIDTANEITERSLHRLAWNVKTTTLFDLPSQKSGLLLWEKKGEGMPLVVFNPHSFPIRRAVQCNTCVHIRDSAGRAVPSQWVRGPQTRPEDHKRTLFHADLPALGYATYYAYSEPFEAPPAGMLKVVREEADWMQRSVKAWESRVILENDFLKVVFDCASGLITSFYDKEAGREFAAAPMAGAVVMDDWYSDSWSHEIFAFENEIGRFADATVTVTEEGPVRAGVRIVSRYATSVLTQDFCLHAGARGLEARCKLDFHEKMKLVKLSFPVAAENPRAAYSMPYGFIEKEPTGVEEPSHEWTAVFGRGDGHGLALLNDCKYSHSVKGADMRMMIARANMYAYRAGPRDDSMEYHDQGEQWFRYTLAPFCRDDVSGVAKAAAVLNQPPKLIPETHHDGKLPTIHSGLNVDADNVMVQVVKFAEDGAGGIVLRAV
ncbi:MAG: alpha-mannosidase [Kiritimatiellaeota bacterium]|nr:alpha-mannosidase [Kiritimatiellota bacterium]